MLPSSLNLFHGLADSSNEVPQTGSLPDRAMSGLFQATSGNLTPDSLDLASLDLASLDLANLSVEFREFSANARIRGRHQQRREV